MNLAERNLMQPKRFRVIFIIDETEPCLLLYNKITHSSYFEIIGQANCTTDGILLAKLCSPDIVLISSKLGASKSKNTVEALRQLVPSFQIFLIVEESKSLNQPCPLNPDSTNVITANVEAEALYAKLLKTSKNTSHNHGLTAREKEILSLLATGQCNKLIGRALNISEGTVKVHVKHILKKLKLRSRLEAALWILTNAQETGLCLA